MNLLDVRERFEFCEKRLIPALVELSEKTKCSIDTVEKKGHGNFVTSVDKKIEYELKKLLSELLPNSGFVAEESGESFNNNNFIWIIDPIDGTTNYIYGYPYTVSVALKNIDTDEILIGVVIEPIHNLVYFGCKDMGSYVTCNGEKRRLKVGTFPKDEGIVIFGMPYNRSKTDKILEIVKNYFNVSSDMKRIGPASLDICRVAAGEAKIYLELDLNIWDVSAGALILKEAGGDYIVDDDLIIFFSDKKYIIE